MQQTTIVIVDSHPVLCEGLTACLSAEPGFRVLATAQSAQQAIDAVTGHRPEVLVLDAELGEARDAELIKRLRSLQPALAIVLLTCHDEAETTASIMRLGASACVLKVAPVEELVEAVRWARQGEMWISPPLLTSLLAQLNASGLDTHHENRLSELTDRESEILELMVEGLGHAEIARRLHLAVNTVRTHTRNIQMKLNVHSNVAAVSVALEEGLRPK